MIREVKKYQCYWKILVRNSNQKRINLWPLVHIYFQFPHFVNSNTSVSKVCFLPRRISFLRFFFFFFPQLLNLIYKTLIYKSSSLSYYDCGSSIYAWFLFWKVRWNFNFNVPNVNFHMNCYSCGRVDGGVSANDFVLQLLADLTGLEVERATTTEMSILGVAFLAGLQCGT